MSIGLKCPHCGKIGTAPDESAGKKSRCKDCDALFVIRHVEEANAPQGTGVKTRSSRLPLWGWVTIAGFALIVFAGVVGVFVVASLAKTGLSPEVVDYAEQKEVPTTHVPSQPVRQKEAEANVTRNRVVDSAKQEAEAREQMKKQQQDAASSLAR